MSRHNPTATGVLPYEKREDEVLMAQYAAGDEGAFREIYGRYRARAYGFISKRVSQPSVVDELFQLTFLKLHHSRARYEPGRRFSAWFFTICRNVVVDHYRARGRSLEMATLNEETATATNESTGEVPGELLKSLPPKQREAIRLRYREELEFAQIARELGTSQSNVRQLISRGVRKIRELVKGRD